MKTIFNKQTPSLDKKVNHYIQILDRECDNFNETNVKQNAKSLALTNQPPPDGDCTPYLALIETHYDTINTKTDIFLQELEEEYIQNIDAPLQNQTDENLNNAIIAKRNEYNSKVINRDSSDDLLYRILMWVLIIIESIWIASVMTSFSDVNIIAIISALVLSFCLLQFVKLATLYWRDNNIPRYQKVIIVFLITIFCIVLGLLRYDQVLVHTAEDGTVMVRYINNPLIYIFLSILPVVACIFIVFTYFLSKSEQKIAKEKKRIKKDIAKLEKRMQEQQKVNRDWKQTNTNNNKNTATLDTYRTQLNSHIHALKQRSIAIFIDENALLRTDSKRAQIKRTPITSFVIPIIIFVAISLSGCHKNTDSTSISILMDITDTIHYQPNIHDILQSQQKQLRTHGCTITVQPISDFHFNPKEVIELPPTSYLFSSDVKRNKQIKRFESSIDSAIIKLTTGQHVKSTSQIIEPIVQCLNEITKSNSSEKELYIFSDLLHNTEQFSCYCKSDMKLLREHPRKAQEKLFNGLSIGDLRSVKIHLIYYAKNRFDDDRWYSVAKCLKDYLERCHATVFIGTNV